MKKIDFDKILKVIMVLLLLWIAKSLDGLSKNGRYVDVVGHQGAFTLDTRTGTTYIKSSINKPDTLFKGFK